MWTKTIGGINGDQGNFAQQTTDGGYIIIANTTSFGAGANDIWLIKTDDSGDTSWTKTFGAGGNDGGNYVQQTTDGGYIIAGQNASFGPVDGWLLKTDSSGDTLWTKFFGGGGFDYINCVQQTSNGGYIIAGRTNSFGASSYDAWLLKTDSSGDTLWTKTFGGSANEYGSSVDTTSDGGYVIAGITSSFGAGHNDVWLIRTDGDGDTLWTKAYGGSNDEWALSVQETSDGGFVVTGTTDSFGAGLNDIWLIKTDGSGDTLWTKTYGGMMYDWGTSVQQTTDGGYIIAGYTDSFGAGNDDMLLIRTDNSGNTLWMKTLGGGTNDRGSSVQQTADGGYIVAGLTGSSGAGGLDVWLIKIAPDITEIEETRQSFVYDYQLHQNYPNPFNPVTTIRFDLPQSTKVQLIVYDILGRKVATRVNEKMPAGRHEVAWSAANYTSGLYFYQLKAGNFVEVRKMLLVK